MIMTEPRYKPKNVRVESPPLNYLILMPRLGIKTHRCGEHWTLQPH